MEEKHTQWVRKLKPLEVFYEVAQRHGTLITVYQAKFSAKTRITQGDVRVALQKLYRKVPSLRLCVRERKDELWFAEMPQRIIDFEIYRHGLAIDVMHSLTHESFDSFRGPLWKARFVEEDNDTPCPSPHLTSDFPFQSQFFIAINHAITDGFSNLKILEFFHQILDKVLGKIHVDDEQLGTFSSGEQTESFLQKRKEELLSDPERFESVRNEVKKAFTNTNTLWADSFGINEHNEYKTYHIAEILDPEMTEQLIEKFKLIGVSINSAFCALLNITMVEMMIERGLLQDFYNIGTLHGVNMRQFWTNDDCLHLGLQIGVMRIYIVTSKDAPNRFGEYAREINKILQEKVKEKWALNEALIQELEFKADINGLHEMFANGIPSHTLLYTASSMGNIDKFIDGSGEHIQWTAVSRTTSNAKVACPFSFNVQKFRKMLSYSIEYCPRFVSKELASLIMTTLKNKLKEITDR